MGASGRYSLISPIGISVLLSEKISPVFLCLAPDLFSQERVARLSFPYPSKRLIAPQMPRPAPRAMTSVCRTSTAELKNAIKKYLQSKIPKVRCSHDGTDAPPVRRVPDWTNLPCTPDMPRPISILCGRTESARCQRRFVCRNRKSSDTVGAW